MTTTPPGWYDDGHGALRWWDGTQWTEHVAQPDAETSPAPTEAEIVAAQLGFDGQEAAPAVASESAVPAEVAAQREAAVSGQPAFAGSPEAPTAQGSLPGQSYPPAGPGYPQGAYPGAPIGGGFTAATEPRRSKSKLWILWVVLGVVLLGIVIAAAVVIPLLFLSATSSSNAGQTDDERAAVSAVELYDDAWQDADCDALTAATTEDFRTENGYTDCAVFEQEAEAFDEGVEDYEIRVTSVETIGDQIVVMTTESYTELVDGSGNPIEPTPGSSEYEYTVIESDGEWLIDSLFTE